MEFFQLSRTEVSAFLQAWRTARPDEHCLAVGANHVDEPLTEPVAVKLEDCELCPFHFVGKAALWRHARAMHDDDDDRLACRMATCGRKFGTLSAAFAHWVHHLRSATALDGRDGFKRADTCELCGRLFWGRDELREHMATRHPDAQDGTCAVCVRYHGDEYAVLEHVRSDHNGDEREPRPRHGPIRARRQRRPRVQYPPYRWL